MKKYFFSHLLEIETVHTTLEESDMDKKDKVYLALLLEETVHNAVISELLSNLNDSDKHEFLEYIHKENHETIWEFLNKKIDNAEDLVKKSIKNLKDEFLADIKKAKS